MKVVVLGATGVIGRAAVEHFSSVAGCEVVAVSRRPLDLPGVVHARVDLADEAATAQAVRSPIFRGATHVVYAALQESSDLAAGWRDSELMARNLDLFRHPLDALAAEHGATLEHVSLLQGAKAYGLHVGRTPLPAKERSPRDHHENFYFLQEDALRALAEGASWSWTVFRPQVVFGESFGSPMNLVPVIGVYAALERERGGSLSFPGGPPAVQEAVDARLLARALAWAADAPAARGQIFNITNGDVFCWHDVWPSIAAVFAMEVGEPRPQRLADTMPGRADEWAALVDRYGLRSPRDLGAFVGGSWAYADILFGSLGRDRQLPALLSTVKIRQAGFRDCIDTEDMLCEWLIRFQERNLLPRVRELMVTHRARSGARSNLPTQDRPGARGKGSDSEVGIKRRRHDPRPVADWAGRYRFEGTERWRDCSVIDVVGSCVTVEPLGHQANEAFEGTVLLELASVSGAEPVQLRGEVRHLLREPGGTVRVGIGFVALSAHAERLLDLLFALRTAV